MVAIGEQLRLTRADLLAFPEETIKLLLEIQKEGWRISRTSKTHLVLLAPDGETRLGCTSNKNSAHYLSEDLRKYHKKNPKEEVVKVRTVQQKWPCPRPGCHKTFISEEKLNLHTAVDHEGMLKCPSCDDLFKRPASLGVHRARKHGYESPIKKRRLELLAEKKKVLDDVVKRDEEADKRKQIVPKLEDVVYGQKMDRTAAEVQRNELPSVPEGMIELDDQDSWTPKPPEEVKLPEPAEVTEDPSDPLVTPPYEDIDVEGIGWDLGIEASKLNLGVDRTPDTGATAMGYWGTTEDHSVGRFVEEQPDIVDSRDSWAMVGLEPIYHMSLKDIIDVIEATGCKMEIRVWKEKK